MWTPACDHCLLTGTGRGQQAVCKYICQQVLTWIWQLQGKMCLGYFLAFTPFFRPLSYVFQNWHKEYHKPVLYNIVFPPLQNTPFPQRIFSSNPQHRPTILGRFVIRSQTIAGKENQQICRNTSTKEHNQKLKLRSNEQLHEITADSFKQFSTAHLTSITENWNVQVSVAEITIFHCLGWWHEELKNVLLLVQSTLWDCIWGDIAKYQRIANKEL